MIFNLRLEDIKYVKILYKNKNGNSVATKAALKIASEHEFLACTKFENELDIETPQTVTLSIICNDGLYRTKTELKSIENDEPYTFFVLTPPNGIEYQQNREFFRVPVNFDCYYSTWSKDGEIGFSAQTYDISANGVSIITSKDFLPVEDSDLSISINNIIIKTRVRYVRTEKIEEGFKHSFFFTNISNIDRDFISQVCLKKQLEAKRNSIY